MATTNVEDVGLVEVLREGEPMVGAEGASEVGDRGGDGIGPGPGCVLDPQGHVGVGVGGKADVGRGDAGAGGAGAQGWGGITG